MSLPPSEPRVIVALDFPSAAEAAAFLPRLDPTRCRAKVGKELFVAAGPAFVEQVQRLGFEVFLDLKFHDIPNTVAQACDAAAKLGVWMINVHASGGRKMMVAAADAVAKAAHRPKLIAVTVLTSLEQPDLNEVGLAGPTPGDAAVRLAALARDSGLDGVVCSAKEAGAMRARFDATFALVTPGIRPADAAADDQARIATPGAAIAAGATYLVIGRPITRASDPATALAAIDAEIAGAVLGA